jgi:hypothetical protein
MKLSKTKLATVTRISRLSPIECNICSSPFRPASKFARFCKSCRAKSELYRISEWLPTADIAA